MLHRRCGCIIQSLISIISPHIVSGCCRRRVLARFLFCADGCALGRAGLNRARLTWSPALVRMSAILLAITLVGFFDYYTWLLVPGRLWQWTTWGLWSIVYGKAVL
jgi:hypothetical protein